MNYAEALRALNARQETKIIPGLERILAHLKSLGDPQENLKVFHVAGTNGKGSTCAILESVLRAAGYKTGFYLSPHLQSPRERMRINGQEISKANFARFLTRTLRFDPQQELTYFEVMTSMAFQYFWEKKTDIVILETGLGGILDATNVVQRPLASIITSIGFDHMNWLGPRLENIAFEKAGIIKKRRPVFCSKLLPVALKPIQAQAKKLKAPLVIVDRSWAVERADWENNSQVFHSPWGKLLKLSLLGDKQGRNVSLAEAVLSDKRVSEKFKISEAAWKKGLAKVRWPGRFEVVKVGERFVILDGAHNPEALENLVQTWKASPWSQKKSLWLLGLMKDKDAKAALKKIAPYVRSLLIVSPPNPRALNAETLAALARRLVPHAFVAASQSVEEAVAIWHNGDAKTLVVCGSFYLVAPLRSALSALNKKEENSFYEKK